MIKGRNDNNQILSSDNPDIYNIRSSVSSTSTRLPLSDDFLRNAPSGDIFGVVQNRGMGLNPLEINKEQYLILRFHLLKSSNSK